MKDAPLHRLEAIVDMRNGTVEDGVAGIVEIPALIHAAQLPACALVGEVDGHGVETPFGGAFVFVGQFVVVGGGIQLLVLVVAHG